MGLCPVTHAHAGHVRVRVWASAACRARRGTRRTCQIVPALPITGRRQEYACMTVNSVMRFHLHVLNGNIDFRALQIRQAGGKIESNIVVSRSLVAFRAIRQQSSRIISLSLTRTPLKSLAVFLRSSDSLPFQDGGCCSSLWALEICNKCMFIRDVRIKIIGSTQGIKDNLIISQVETVNMWTVHK